MAFSDDLQAVTWTSPSGQVFTLKTLESGYTRKHIGEVKENPRTSTTASTSSGGKGSKTSSSTSSGKKRVGDVNDTFTDLGVGGKEVTLDCYFVGENHFIDAETFTNALCETGKSKLKLAFGQEFTVNVINFGSKNTLTTNINCTVVNVQWHQTAQTTYPASEKNQTKAIKNAAETTKANIAQNMAEAVANIQNQTRLQAFQASFTNALNKVSGALDFADNLSLKTIMNDILGQNITSSALTMTSQLGIVLYKAAVLGRKIKNLGSSFDLTGSLGSLYGGWSALISTLINNSSTPGSITKLSKNQIDNLMINDAAATMAIISYAESILEQEFETREEAVDAAKDLVALEQTWTNFVDSETDKIAELENLFTRDDGLQKTVAAVANEIIERSYKLKVEKKVILTEDTSIIDLAYKYYTNDFYADPDGTIDYLIKTNGLSDNQFFMLPRGSEVKIYV